MEGILIKVSVIIPVYKVEKYLRQCVDSVLHQTYKNLEVILVDDGSPDQCPQICNEYALSDNRVCVIHQPNGGLSEARKSGIHLATSDYLMIVDGDDWLENTAIEQCVKAVCDHDHVDCVIFSYVREYPQRSLIAHVLDESAYFGREEAEDRIHRRLFGLVDDEFRHPERLEGIGSCCMKLYRADIARKGRFFDTKEVGSSEDTLFNIFALYDCQNVVYIDEPLYHYRKAGNSITSTFRPTLIHQWNRLFDIMEESLSSMKVSERYRQALDGRIALSILGIGTNEMGNRESSFFQKVKLIRKYISSERYQHAVRSIRLKPMPLPWKALIGFTKCRAALLVSLELLMIEKVKKSQS